MVCKKLQWDADAWADYIYWQSQDKKTLKTINLLISDILRNAYEGIGKPEALKDNLSRLWSRRIDEKNRIVYIIKNDTVTIISCNNHYDF